MGVYIKDMAMPSGCDNCCYSRRCPSVKERMKHEPFKGSMWMPSNYRHDDCPLVEVAEPHGDLIDRNRLSRAMYHEAFETDTDLQKWESGCWIRYKMFEDNLDAEPTVIEAEGE